MSDPQPPETGDSAVNPEATQVVGAGSQPPAAASPADANATQVVKPGDVSSPAVTPPPPPADSTQVVPPGQQPPAGPTYSPPGYANPASGPLPAQPATPSFGQQPPPSPFGQQPQPFGAPASGGFPPQPPMPGQPGGPGQPGQQFGQPPFGAPQQPAWATQQPGQQFGQPMGGSAAGGGADTLPIAMWATIGLMAIGLIATVISLIGAFSLVYGAGIVITTAVITLVIVAGAGACAWFAGQGQNWGRVVLTVFFALGIISSLLSVGRSPVISLIEIVLLIGLLVLWWMPSTTAGMAAKRAARPQPAGGYGQQFGQPQYGQPQFGQQQPQYGQPQSQFGAPQQQFGQQQFGQPQPGQQPYGQPPQPPTGGFPGQPPQFGQPSPYGQPQQQPGFGQPPQQPGPYGS
jgi:hypothetical protein